MNARAVLATAPSSDSGARGTINRALDRLVRTDVYFGDRALPAFRVCGFAGLGLAWVLALTLVSHRGLPLWPMAVVALAAMATFLLLAMVTKIVSGQERLVYYHHEIAIVVASALILRLLGRPVLAYLDPTILGVGLFLAFGRIGCFLVGCCHGCPAGWGVRYRGEHAEAGFPAYYVGVRLIPIQLVESAWVFFLVAVGSALVWTGYPPGSAFVWYVVAYDVGRFCFEFARGDPTRPDHGGFSSPQWVSVLLTLAVVAAGWFDLLPTRPWHSVVAVALVLTVFAVALHRRLRSGGIHRLRHPHHVQELAEVLVRLDDSEAASDAVAVAATPGGVLISAGTVAESAGVVRHYTLSARSGTLDAASARVLAGLILVLRGPGGTGEVVAGGHGVYHVVIGASATTRVDPGLKPRAEATKPLRG